ncbi:hypothetical protein [Companilactobacillus mishanensis]|uniref:Prophage tail endopeptidase domain-containing protein n=1 Tax=Companilactobacillus mishanensis TaxID=2486008 RepID=A0A5P0ZGJ5_9LACO|nr:hypothetical protein [Companilactobacillus mishanensis]MQS52176.1 hypothetical protein [Companilactobacillus mishanensis]
MKPQLFKDINTHMTVGRISDAYGQSVHEVLNGEYTYTFSVNKESKFYNLIKPEMFVEVATTATDTDYFYVTKIQTKNPGVRTFTCNHYTMQINNNYVRGEVLTNGRNAKDIISDMVSKLDFPSQRFNYHTDINDNAGATDVSYLNQNPGTILVGDTNSLASIFNARLVRHDTTLTLTSLKTGNSIDLRKGKNISGVDITSDISKLTTSIVGWYTVKDVAGTTDQNEHVDKNHRQYSQEINSKYKGNYQLPHRMYIDYSSRVDNIPDLVDLVQNYFNENPGIDLPTYTISIDSTGSNSKRVQVANIGDTARIYDPDYDLSTEQLISERTFDPDLMINTSLKAGTVQQTIFRYLDKRIKDASQKADDNKAQTDSDIADTKDDMNKIFDETSEKIDDVNELGQQQKKMLEDYQAAVTTKVNNAQRDISNFMNSGGNNKIRWIPTLAEATQMEITTPYGYLLIDDHGIGFHKNNGTVITGMSSDGRFYADTISTKSLDSITLNSATINGGQINGVNIGSVGSIYTKKDYNGHQTVINSTYGISTHELNMGNDHGNINNVGTLSMTSNGGADELQHGIINFVSAGVIRANIHFGNGHLVANKDGKDYIIA